MLQNPLDFRAYSEMKDIMEEVLPELLKTFNSYMPDLLKDLNQAITANNPDLVFGISHRMKSSCNSLSRGGVRQQSKAHFGKQLSKSLTGKAVA